MGQFLLRIEAVNLDHFIFDTTDLATIRGAGLLLLNTPRFLEGLSDEGPGLSDTQGLFSTLALGQEHESLQFDPTSHPDLTWDATSPIAVTAVTRGASIAVYQFAATPDDADRLRVCTRAFLSAHRQLRFATFSVAVIESQTPANYRGDFERLLSRSRMQQMRNLDLVVGPGNQEHTLEGRAVRFCDIDRLRPGTEHINEHDPLHPEAAYARSGDKNWICNSAAARRSYGRKTKVRVYQMFGASQSNFVPTWSFEELTTRQNKLLTPERLGQDAKDPLSDLAGKMAILYIDGNRFGKLQQSAATSVAQQQKFDAGIQQLRRQLMTDLVQKINASPRWQVAPSEKAQEAYNAEHDGDAPVTLPWQGRIETLMWGGDELIWAVPAWCALDAVQFFFEHTADWRDSVTNKRLTHAVGMVLCAHNAPIRAIVQLARELAAHAKDQLPELAKRFPNHLDGEEDDAVAYSPIGNALAYEVLESFDHLGRDFLAARRDRRFKALKDVDLLLPGVHFQQIVATLQQLAAAGEGIASRRLYQIAAILHRPNSTDKAFDTLIHRIAETSTLDARQLKELEHEGESLFHSQQAKWHHVLELWRYVPKPHQGPSQTPGGQP